MDAVELALPQEVAAPKLMGSEGLGGTGGVGVSAAKVDPGHSGCNSIDIRPSVDADGCSRRDKILATNATEQSFWNKTSDNGYFMPKGPPSSFHGADDFEDINLERKDGSVSLITGLGTKQLHRSTGKVGRSNSGSSKRSRILQMEVSINETAEEDMKGCSTGIASCAAKSVVAEKTQMARQKNNANGKRGDKRTGRIPKSRCDTFSLKNGFVSFSTIAGGGSIPVYNSKSGIFDVSKHVDELPLNELLDGSYNYPSLVKDKGKGVENSNEGFLNSVRKACSLLRLQSPVHVQNPSERDNNCNQVSVGTVSTSASLASRNDGGKGENCSVNQPSEDKLTFEDESCGRLSALATSAELPLCSPKDILDRLSLPASRDLDSLLLDAGKSASSSRNNSDLRLGKTTSNRTGLPPFPWSHSSSGHSKSGADAVKLSSNRTTCQGRWVKVENSLTPLKDSTGFLVDLESLAYDHRIVPTGNVKSGPSASENASSSRVHFSSSVQVSSAACSASGVPQAGGRSPQLLAAAETLCEIAVRSSKQNSNGMMKLLKRPSQKTMKTCKLKSNEKPQGLYAAPKPSIRPDDLIKVADDGILPSKKFRLSIDEKSEVTCHTNPTIKGSMNLSSSRLNRSSPSKLSRDPVPDSKHHHTNNTVKKSYMMPPPARVTDKAGFSNQQKPKKIAPMEWQPAASKLD